VKEIYIVTDGDYSDYHIIGVWESKEKAQAWVDAYRQDGNKWGDPSIEVWPFEDDPEFAEFRRTTVHWRVEMSVEGDVLKCYMLSRAESTPAELRAPSRSGYAAGFFFSEGVAADKEHAIKIAAERWAEWKWKKEQNKAQKKARAK
jgi:hypothetical protein